MEPGKEGTTEVQEQPLPVLARFFPNVFYGWVITGSVALVMFATVGVGFYSMGVFLDGLPGERGFSPVEVAAPTSLFFILQGVLGPPVGRLVDRRGPRDPIMAGAVLMSLSLLLLGQVDQAWQLWPVYTLMAVGFSLSSSVATGALLMRWFTQLRARAMAISHTGVSAGGMVVTPLAVYVLHAHGVELATWLLAALVVGIALPMVYFAISADPRPHGLRADGGAASLRDSKLLTESYQRDPWTPRETLVTQTFWVMAVAFSLVLFAQHCVLLHEVALVHERTGSAQAGAFAVTLTAFASAASRLVVGSFADRFDKQKLAGAVMLVQAVSLWLMAGAESLAGLYACALLFGFTIGNIFMLQSLLVGEFFGFASFGTAFGMLTFVTQIAGGLGPWGLTQLNAALGGYGPSLQVLACMVVAGSLVVLLARAPSRGPRAGASTA